jgi:hypothetical protein
LAFSIMCNDQTGHADSIRLIDQIASLVALYPDVPTERIQKSQ